MRSLAIWLMTAVLLAATAEARTLDEVRARGKLVACLYPNALPFSKENGNPEGIYVELARAVASPRSRSNCKSTGSSRAAVAGRASATSVSTRCRVRKLAAMG